MEPGGVFHAAQAEGQHAQAQDLEQPEQVRGGVQQQLRQVSVIQSCLTLGEERCKCVRHFGDVFGRDSATVFNHRLGNAAGFV